jgi:alkylhydroperoxidase/carboxymuconolactone decarboxylase family protein YurZ
MEDWQERKARKQRVDAAILGGPGRVLRGFREIGPHVFRDGALSKKHKELMALAVAVSQNCFD